MRTLSSVIQLIIYKRSTHTYITYMYVFILGNLVVIFCIVLIYQYSDILNFPSSDRYIYYIYTLPLMNHLAFLYYTIVYNTYFVQSLIPFFIEFFLCTIACLLYSVSYNYNKTLNLSSNEYLFLLSIATVVAICVLNATSTIELYILVETLSVCIYVLTAFNRNNIYSIESGIKYFIVGSVASFFFILGFILLYSLTGFTYYIDLHLFFISLTIKEIHWILLPIVIALLCIVLGFFAKMYVAPFHFWIADIYQGAPLTSAVYFSTIYYYAIFYIFMQLHIYFFSVFFFFFKFIYFFFSIFTMLAGCIGGVFQLQLRKILAYSSITNSGYTISVFYLNDYSYYTYAIFLVTLYSISILGTFFIVLNIFTFFFETFNNINLLFLFKQHSIYVSTVLSFFLFLLSSFPPFSLFFVKVSLYSYTLFELEYAVLAVYIICSFVSTFYYMRIIKNMYYNTYKYTYSIVRNVSYSMCTIYIYLVYITFIVLYFFYVLLNT